LLLLILYFAAPFIGLGALGGFGELSAGSWWKALPQCSAQCRLLV